MWRERFLANIPKVFAAASAVVLGAAVVLYAPVATGISQGLAMDVRTKLILLVLILSAASTALLIARRSDLIRSVASLSNGFNLVWIFSFIGAPVVVAALFGIVAAVTLKPRRVPFLILAICGLALGALTLRLTEPPGEHIFG